MMMKTLPDWAIRGTHFDKYIKSHQERKYDVLSSSKMSSTANDNNKDLKIYCFWDFGSKE